MGIVVAVALTIGGIFAAAFSQQLSEEFKAWTPRLVQKIIARAVRRLPSDLQDRFREEWQAHVADTPGYLGKLLVALGFMIAAHRIRAARMPLAARAKFFLVIITTTAALMLIKCMKLVGGRKLWGLNELGRRTVIALLRRAIIVLRQLPSLEQ